jgi:hypothetical protein
VRRRRERERKEKEREIKRERHTQRNAQQTYEKGKGREREGKGSEGVSLGFIQVLLNVKARLFSRDQPATYLAADVIFKAATDCTAGLSAEASQRSLVGCTSLAMVGGGDGTVLRLERLTPEVLFLLLFS